STSFTAGELLGAPSYLPLLSPLFLSHRVQYILSILPCRLMPVFCFSATVLRSSSPLLLSAPPLRSLSAPSPLPLLSLSSPSPLPLLSSPLPSPPLLSSPPSSRCTSCYLAPLPHLISPFPHRFQTCRIVSSHVTSYVLSA